MPYTALQLAEAHLQAGELAESLACLNVHLVQHPDDPQALRLRSQLLMHSDRVEDLEQALHDLQQLQTDDWQDVQRLAFLYEKRGNPQQAILILQQALERIPHERLRGYLLELYRRLGRLQEALALAQESGWDRLVAELALELDDYPLAQSAWTRCIASFNSRLVPLTGLEQNQLWWAYWKRGLAFAHDQQWEVALVDFKQAIALSVVDLQLVKDALDMIARLRNSQPYYSDTLEVSIEERVRASQLPSRFAPDAQPK